MARWIPSSPPLGGEHHEDEEDEQDSRCDREGAERREKRHERAALNVGRSSASSLKVDLEAQRPEHRCERSHDLVGQPDAGPLVPAVGDQDMASLVEPPKERLAFTSGA